ncbi:MAG: hypothetical protein HGA65_16850, partial [Oscillochloris sp.]|nr:hypothetical protein [Oscillochloris sp.]
HAARALFAAHPNLDRLLAHLSLDLAAQTAAQNGTLTQPSPLRWWGSTTEEQRILLLFTNASDEQTLMARHQAFVGHLSHELRTPLTALTAHAEIALREGAQSAVLRASLQIIRSETQRSARLVRDLLELYRLEISDSLAPRQANLVLVAESAIAQLIMPAEERGHQIRFHADASLPAVWVDPDRMAQVFVNLLQNAIVHTRPGDDISVSLRRDGGAVVCEVADTGPGIDPADLPHITERFYRGRSRGDGSGLGLAIASEILRRQGATLDIRSVSAGLQTGSTFSWRLPVLNAETIRLAAE